MAHDKELRHFVDYCKKHITGDEAGEAQLPQGFVVFILIHLYNFLSVNLEDRKFQFQKNLGRNLFNACYTVGIFCLAYMANFVKTHRMTQSHPMSLYKIANFNHDF